MRGQRPNQTMSGHDTAVWHTVRINDLIDRGSIDECPRVTTTFAPMDASEHVFAQGPFGLFNFEAMGDGSYVHSSGAVFATGGAAAAFAGAFTIAQALGNRQRKRVARAAAQPRWRQIDAGSLWVSSHGVHFATAMKYYSWAYSAIDALELISPGTIRFEGRSLNGPISWVLESDWAELAFTLWARSRHPNHPQFVSRAWVPAGWRERVIAGGYALP